MQREDEEPEDELLAGDPDLPACPHCGRERPEWRGGRENRARARICPACKRKSEVWNYRVYVVRKIQPKGK